MSSSILDRFRIPDRVAIITGAGKGIGAATALGFADAGGDVVITARTASDLDQVAEQVRARGRRAVTIAGDANDLDHLAAVVDAAMNEFGRLDIVVNNAGGTTPVPFDQISADYLAKSLHFNVVSRFELSRLACGSVDDPVELFDAGHGHDKVSSHDCGRVAGGGGGMASTRQRRPKTGSAVDRMPSGSWRARLQLSDGSRISLGTFRTKTEAPPALAVAVGEQSEGS